MNLADIHTTYKKWFHIEDINRIDLILAVALSRKIKGTPIWLIIISNSGDMKSEQILALDDSQTQAYAEGTITTKLIHRFTPRTLVTGDRNTPDLAPKLDDKILLIPDMAQLLTLHPNDKAAIWAQLRDLFDGYAGMQSGLGKDAEYRDIHVTLIAGATPAIDDQILIHQSLGTRELLYRPKEIINKEMLMEKVWDNESVEDKMHKEIRIKTQLFLLSHDINPIEISKEVAKKIKYYAQYLAVLRASGSIDSYSGELRSLVYPEQPTRALKQLKKLYFCLMSLDEKYSSDQALEIVKEVVESSIDPIRKMILSKLLEKDSDVSTNEIANELRIGQKTAKSELAILWNLKLVNMHEEEISNGYGNVTRTKNLWSANRNHSIIKGLMSPHQITIPIINNNSLLQFSEDSVSDSVDFR